MDDDAPDPCWPAPDGAPGGATEGASFDRPGTRTPRAGRRNRRLITVGIPVMITVSVLVLVWTLGGFGRRHDRVQQVTAGSPVTQGPLMLRFTRATVQETTGYGKDKRIQKVVVHGTARNIWTESFSPEGAWFAVRDPAGTLTSRGELFSIDRGNDLVFDAPDDLTPGLPAVPVTVQFELPTGFRPGHTILFGASTVDYGKHSFFSTSSEQTWDTDGGVYRMRLPLTVLEPQPQH